MFPLFGLIFFQLTYLQLQRFIFLFFLPDFNVLDLKLIELLDLYITSIRFDLMVVGFFLIPLLAIHLLEFYIKRYVKHYKKFLLRGYIFISTLLVGIISIFDYLWFEKSGDRIGREFLATDNVFPSEFKFKYVFVILLLLLATYFSNRCMLFFANKFSKNITDWKMSILQIFVALILARGSFSAHHLDLRHAEVTKNPLVNRLVVPSPYALDQALRNRR